MGGVRFPQNQQENKMNNRIGFGMRFGAFVLDIILVGILAGFLAPMLGSLIGLASTGDEAGAMGGMLGGTFLAAPLIGALYFLLEGITGFTLGKLLMGIRVGYANGDMGTTLLFLKRYAIKNSGILLSTLAGLASINLLGTIGGYISLVFFLGCLLVLLPKKQALHDFLAQTAVFPKKKLQA